MPLCPLLGVVECGLLRSQQFNAFPVAKERIWLLSCPCGSGHRDYGVQKVVKNKEKRSAAGGQTRHRGKVDPETALVNTMLWAE
jgi:hypothetical protein